MALAVEEHGDHGRVAQQALRSFLGEAPAVAAQDEVVDVAQPGKGAQVDVDVDPHGGAGAGAAAGPPTTACLGPAEPAADGVEPFQRVGQVEVGVEGLVEGVDGGPAVEGVLCVEILLPLRPLVGAVGGGGAPAGVVGVEGGAAHVVQVVGS
ncbi:MAG TPA: hypothetical protein DCS55_13465, partial [Acidimicrobiaceae bacterium]|nr:hypothetical protein [Acidimicrobiaceae bacterium]